jgi:erythronate-4-phosphate dehydrogenase
MKIVADINIPLIKSALKGLGDVEVLDKFSITPEAVRDADALLVRSETRVNRSLLEGSSVRFVATATSGIDHIDVDYLKAEGIGFCDALGCNANSVAEYIMAALLHLSRLHDFKLHGKSIGVIGVGNVGSKVVRNAKALGMEVLQNDPPRERREGGSQFLPLAAVMEADIITCHVPLTKTGMDKTLHLFDAARFEKVKPGCIFLNASRGGVVDTAGIRSAIRSEKLRHTVLDVWENEPEIDLELLQMVDIGSSHIAGYSFDGKIKGTRMIREGFCRFFDIDSDWHPEDEMPPPSVDVIRVGKNDAEIETVLHNIVKQCYDIVQDHQNLLQLLDHPEDKGAQFVKLRRSYPVRREFFNIKVVMPPESDEVSGVLSEWGFKVSG